MDIAELVNALRGYSVAILSDDAYGAVLFVNHITSVMCGNSEDVVFVVYRESTCRKLYRIMLSLREENRCIDKFFESVKVVKVGKTPETCFGELVAFVEDNENIVDVAAEIGRILRNKFPESTIVFFGFNLGIQIYEVSNIVRALEELFSRIRNTTYFVVSSREVTDLMANVFDVVVCISKIESFGMRPNNIYNVYIEHSIISRIQQMPLYRIDEMGLVEL